MSDEPFLECPKCNDGHAGVSHDGEAMECYYCDGTGRLTVSMFVELKDRWVEAFFALMFREVKEQEGR